MQKNNLQHNSQYLGYIRVSSKDQASGLSLEVQQSQIEGYARDREIKIGKFFGGVESASQTGREEFGEMLGELKRGNYQGIIFHKVDRSGRNPSDQAKLYELMEQGYEFHFVVERLSTKEHTARTMLYLLWGMASGFSENLKSEVNKGIYGMLRAGKYPNPAPIGYKNMGRGVKEVDEFMGPIIKKAFEWFATGRYDILALHKKITDMGLLTRETPKYKPKALHPKTLYKILRNRWYYGQMVYNGESYVGAHKTLISKELFDKVQTILDKRSFKHQRTLQYVFQGLLSCRVCGKPLRSISAKGKYKYYACRNLVCKCNLNEDFVGMQFEHDLSKIEFSEEEVLLFLKAVAVFRQELHQSKEDDIRNINMELAKVKAETDRLLQLYLQQNVSEADYKSMRSKLVNRELELSERKDNLERADSKTVDQIAEIGKLLKRPSLAYGMASDEKKRFLVKSLVENFSWSEGKLITNWQKQYRAVAERPRNEVGSLTNGFFERLGTGNIQYSL